jgi:hypothetical protein
LNLRQRCLCITDRLVGVLLVILLAGTTLAFGGATWWSGPAIAGLTTAFVLACLVRVVLEGEMRVLKTPLTALGFLALGLAALQLAPLPATWAARISPRSREIYALGTLPRPVLDADPSITLPEPAAIRSPVTVDRSATLRWLAGATVCLALFWGVSQFADRLGRLHVVCGSIVAAFMLNTAFALVQLVGGMGGLYGFIHPGQGPIWAPTVHELLTTPNATALRTVAPVSGATHPTWAALVPDHPFLIGSLMGGPGAYLALGSIGLPLGLALLLQRIAPRGSRDGLWVRLGETGHGGLVVLLAVMLAASAGVVGLLAGPLLAVPFAVALVFVGLPSAWPTGLRWSGLAMTSMLILWLGGGVLLGDVLARMPGMGLPVAGPGVQAATRVWADCRTMVRDFPLLGSGLGSFASIYPWYKTADESRTTAQSSLVQWWVEAGGVGVALVLMAGTWCLVRLPGAVRRVGTADRALAFGLIGAATGFTLFSAVHWTVELVAVAMIASALGGTWNRWLAGASDLFVERG